MIGQEHCNAYTSCLALQQHPSCDNDSVPDLETACCHQALMVSQEHCIVMAVLIYRPDALPVAQPTASKH